MVTIYYYYAYLKDNSRGIGNVHEYEEVGRRRCTLRSKYVGEVISVQAICLLW